MSYNDFNGADMNEVCDAHSVRLNDLPDGWSCMSVNGFAVGGTEESLDRVKHLTALNTAALAYIDIVEVEGLYSKAAQEHRELVVQIRKEL